MSRSSSDPKKINALLEVCPGLFYGGCHGIDEKQVFAELCEIVEEVIELYRQDGKPLPPATAGRDFA